jgi:hypothetical protein
MAQHFLFSKAAKTLSLASVFRIQMIALRGNHASKPKKCREHAAEAR